MSKIHIGYTDENIFNDKSTHPKLIRNNKPNWFINIKKYLYTETPFGKQKIKTVKSCPSFVDMFNNGVVVYAPTDIKLFVDQEKVYVILSCLIIQILILLPTTLTNNL